MSAAALPVAVSEPSPKAMARAAAIAFLVTIVAGIIAQVFISERLFVARDAAATARNILANEPLHRLGFTIYLIEMSAQIVMTWCFYQLLKPVSRPVALLSALFDWFGAVIKTMSRLFFLMPLLVLGSAPYLGAFDEAQRQGLALLFFNVNDQGAGMALGFFGFSSILQGWLVIKSGFLPRWLGAIGVVAGFGWLMFLSPSVGLRFLPVIAIVGLLGSVLMIGWLLVRGVDDERWRAQARAATASIWR
jgi:hypothetical protein